MYYIYLLESEKDGRYYIGQTSNLEERIVYHNSNRSKYTKNKGPWKLMGYKTFQTRSEAMKEEKILKGMKNRDYIIKIFDPKPIASDDIHQILELTIQDKKNVGNVINCSLLKKIGSCDFNISTSHAEIIEAIKYYNSLF